MLSGDLEKLYPSAKTLVKECAASRLHAKAASLYGFAEDAQACAERYMGWTDLASNPPYPLHEIQAFADSVIAQGLKTVVLIGQGGSTQAPMTITKYNKSSWRNILLPSPIRAPLWSARHARRAGPPCFPASRLLADASRRYRCSACCRLRSWESTSRNS